MKRALIFSDSHGNLDNLLDVLKQYKDAQAIFFLGDVEGDADRLRRATPYPVYMVRGNCDFGSDIPLELNIEFAGKRIVMTHGNRHLGYGGIDAIKNWAMLQGADIAMFGHTHIPHYERVGDLVILNPGSISRPRQEGHIPTYTIMEADEDGSVRFHMCRYIKEKC